MKFLSCSRCFTTDSPSQQSTSHQPVQEITNPLVVTKRPTPKVVHPRKATTTDSNRKRRFPAIFSALTSWPRKNRRPQQQPQQPQKRNIRKTVRVIEPPPRRRYRPPTRTQRLIRLYEEQARYPDLKHELYHREFLIDPPASFSGDDESLESHQNFKNKLNTLDFRRMNTVALEAEPATSRSESALYRKNSYSEEPAPKFAGRKTLLEDFLKERLQIEQTMIDLLNKQPTALKKSRNEEKKVRFDVGGDKTVELTEDGRVEARETEIKVRVDPDTRVEDFYVERKTTYLKDRTVEDKALVLKIGEPGPVDEIGMRRDLVFRNFGKMSL